MSEIRKPTAILTAAATATNYVNEELSAVDPGAIVLAELDPGVFLISGDLDFFELAEKWRLQPPIFVRHICPVMSYFTLAGDHSDLAAQVRALDDEFVDLIDPALRFSVQSRVLAQLLYKPFDVNRAISDQIRAKVGAELDVRAPQQILSVVCASAVLGPSPRSSNWCFMGLSLPLHNLSDWAGGMRRFARETGQVSRSEFKLLEALEVFGLELEPRGTALDLGASPGGWTRILRQHEQYVTAVDPGDLHPTLASDSDVRHKRMIAQTYLEDDPDKFDLIVNDMRMDARDSARLMVDYAPQLYRNGLVIMTLKLPEQGRHNVIDHAFAILRKAYLIEGARQLFHNRSEITLLLRPIDPKRR